jgi:hypothetical protein
MNSFYALQKLYPQIVTVRGDVAYDADDNVVEYDPALVDAEISKTEYQQKRTLEYPDFRNYLDGVVKGDQAQIDAYVAACLAVKAKYPKPEQ